MLYELAIVIQLAIGLVFAASALSKARSFRAFVTGLDEYDLLPNWLIRPAAASLIVVESVIAFTHLAGWKMNLATPFTFLVLLGFSIPVVAVLRRGETPPCLCFGSLEEEVSYRALLRLVTIAIAEFSLWFLLVAPTTEQRAPSATAFSLSMIAAGLGLGVMSWLFRIHEIRRLLSDSVRSLTP